MIRMTNGDTAELKDDIAELNQEDLMKTADGGWWYASKKINELISTSNALERLLVKVINYHASAEFMDNILDAMSERIMTIREEDEGE